MRFSAGTAYHLAHIHLGTMKGTIYSPIMAEFRSQIAHYNALADRSAGFVWRLQTEDGDTTSLNPFDDDRIFVTMSVWNSIESLSQFAYHSEHLSIFRQRKKWFLRHPSASLALWWIKVGSVPTLLDGKERLAHIDKNGPTLFAFTFNASFPPPDAALFSE